MVSKKKLFLQITMGKIKKSAAGENFCNTDCFYTKNSAKMQKMANRKFIPPVGRDRKCIYFGNPPRLGGDYRKSPPLGGDLPPPGDPFGVERGYPRSRISTQKISLTSPHPPRILRGIPPCTPPGRSKIFFRKISKKCILFFL